MMTSWFFMKLSTNFRQQLQIWLKIASCLYNLQKALLISLLSVKMLSLSLKTLMKIRTERKLQKKKKRNQKLIKNQLKMLISLLNKNIWWKELCQVLKIILMILDQEIRSSKNSSIMLVMIFMFTKSTTICF